MLILPAPLLWKVAPYAIAVLVGGGWFLNHDRQQRAIGARDTLLKQDRMTIAALEDNAKHQAVQYTTDTVRLHEVTTQWRTITAHYRDTLAVHDTVSVPVERVREVVRAGDSTIAACALVVSDCNQRLTTATAIGENYRNQLQLTKAAVPNAFSVWGWRVLWGAAGAGVGYLLRR